jgi:predicted aldo/keto reductase-like oxidoreductase
MAQQAAASGQFDTIMFPFNFITAEPAEELLPLAREHDVGFIVMKPMGGGMLDNATLAFKYLLQFRDVIHIPGIETVAEFEEIMKIFTGPKELTEEEAAETERLRDELGTRFCRRCEYCQPCPQQIPISMVMNISGFVKRMPGGRVFSGGIAGAMERAATCTECGDCLERCPYHLPIPTVIAEKVEWYGEAKEAFDKQAA